MQGLIPRSLYHACIITLAVASFAGKALADGNDSGPYVGAGYGQFNVTIDNLESAGQDIRDIDTDDGAWKAFFGWRFNKFFSLEGDYIDLGNPRGGFDASGSNGNYSVDLSGFGIYAIGTLPITIFELSAKVGYYYHDVTIKVDLESAGSGNQDIVNSDKSTEAFTYGVGAGVTLIDHLNVNVEYERMEFDKLSNAYVVWLTGAWRF